MTKAILWRALVGGVLAGLIWGCATTPGPAGSELSGPGPTQPPADPLFRRSFTTPRGSTWDFQLGGYTVPGDR